jgi:hypothetical protein
MAGRVPRLTHRGRRLGARIGQSMTNVPEDWKPHGIKADRAWKRGDADGLVKVCDRVIKSLAGGFGKASRISPDELHRKKAADLRQAGLYKSREVADLDQLF